jgi:hypothetical protein
MEITKQEAAQHSDALANSANANDKERVSAKSLTSRTHRSAMPAPGRKVSFEEAVEGSVTQNEELLRRLSK